MPRINEAESAARHVEGDIHVAGEFAGVEPNKLPIEFEVEYKPRLIKGHQWVFATAFDSANTLARYFLRGRFWAFYAAFGERADDDRVNHAAPANSLSGNERPQRSNDCLDFGKFGHVGVGAA
jgi:hypothetical protein